MNAVMANDRRPVSSQRHNDDAAIKANTGDSVSALHATPRAQNMALADMATVASAAGKTGMPAASNHAANIIVAKAVETAARSRAALRRPCAIAIDPRAANTDVEGGAPIGTSSAGTIDCDHGGSPGVKT